ncbi:MAG: metal-dependent transcriptional regulator [Candidatus Eisenbacteria bacterium]|nr:metal-dependent transcriptional regulator [Candidatus Eisenbacteria bacterium]
MEQERKEEMLELLWTLREGGDELVSKALKASKDENPAEVMDTLISERLVDTHGDKVTMTAKGEEIAREIIRRHRLAEVLLAQVLDVEDAEMDDAACKFEHILSPRVTDSICTFLGHPPVCPHGMPIPPGPCCKNAETKLEPLVVKLTNVEVGADVAVVFIAPALHATLDRLAGFGVVPGSKIRLHQKTPSYVVQVGETTVGLDEEIAKGIFVKRV